MAKITHIGLIPDGNRRWAIEKGCDFLTAYKIAIQNISKFVSYAFQKNITALTIYVLSRDNFNRKAEEVKDVIEHGVGFFKDTVYELSRRYECKIVHAGRADLMPVKMFDALQEICAASSHYQIRRIYLLVGYHPMDEINHAFVMSKGNPISLAHFWVPENIDLVIRTAGGPTLISNFVPLQCGYAQIYTADKYFNDFNEDDFNAIYSRATEVNMRYGL